MKAEYRSLADYFDDTGETQHALAARLGITRTYVCLLASGRRQPGLRLAIRIHELTGVRIKSLVANYREARAS